MEAVLGMKTGPQGTPCNHFTMKQKSYKLWCANCWTRAKAACPDAQHRLLEPEQALLETGALCRPAWRELEHAQQRMNALTDILEEDTVTLVMDLEAFELDEDCHIDGSTLRIVLAARNLSDGEKAQVCRALENVDVEMQPKHDGDWTTITGSLYKSQLLRSTVEKFPDRIDGLSMKKGTVLVCPKTLSFTIHGSEVGPGVGHGTKVLGRCTGNFSVMTCTCSEHYDKDGTYCFCVKGALCTSLVNVEVARQK